VYFTAGEKSTIERHLYRIRFDGTGMERLSKEDGYHRPSFSREGKQYVDNFSSVSIPPALSLRRGDGTLIQALAGPQLALLTPFALQFPRFFQIPAADGLALPAQLSVPKDFDPAKKYPLVIYVYGGPASPSVSNGWNSNAWSQSIYFDQVLLDHGYLVMAVDNRSSASSKTLEKSIWGQMYGDVELGDLLAATKWIKAQPYVDPARVGIWGWSGGAMYTLLALTRSKEFKAGISVAPVTDWHYYDAKWAELPMKRPEENPAGYEKTSLVKRAGDLHGRLLLVHGSYDDNVHPQNSQAFVDGLVKAGITFDMMVYPMRKHTIDDPPARIHLYTTMLEFWKKNL
jgi:dipeptidyl-peptidase-4